MKEGHVRLTAQKRAHGVYIGNERVYRLFNHGPGEVSVHTSEIDEGAAETGRPGAGVVVRAKCSFDVEASLITLRLREAGADEADVTYHLVG